MKCAVLCSVVWLAVSALAQSGSRPRNIFDDDWEPPKRPAPLRPQATTRETPGPPDTNVPTTVTPTVTAPLVSSKAVARRPIPKPADQVAVRKVMRELYAEQLKDASPAGRQKLTRVLLEQADKLASDAPTDQFVLLTAAVDAGLGASSLTVVFAAADRLARWFEVDGLAVKADAVSRFRSTVPAEASRNVAAALALSSELEASDDLQSALRVCTAVQPVAAISSELRAQVAGRIRELNLARDAEDRAAKDRETLKTAPEDPAANLAVGRYECLIRGRWDEGLPLLAKGSDGTLKAAAQSDLSAGASPSAEVAVRVADAWWEIAAKQNDPRTRAVIANRAAAFYERGLKGVTGLQKSLVEKRIAEARKLQVHAATPGGARTGRVDLLALFDPAKDIVKGQWESTAEGLVSDRGNENRVAFPYHPPAEYDLIVEFTRMEGTEHVFLLFTWEGRNGGCILGSEGGKVCGISQVDGRSGSDDRNPTKKVFPAGIIQQGKRHRCLLEVRKAGIRAQLDDAEVISFNGRPAQLSQNSPWAIQEGLVGVAKVGGRVAFHTVEIRPVSGTGKPLRPSSNR